MQVNISKLKKEMFYHPAWAEDKDTFIDFLYQSNFSNNDIIVFARLYVKYSHIHCFHKTELTNYFNYMLKKMQIPNSRKLFSKTHDIYSRRKSRS
jgi:hypothetical protein